MEELFEKYLQKLQLTPVNFVRAVMEEINWDARLIGIKGARGIGKTTLLLQYIKLKLASSLEETLYVSVDTLWFSTHSIVELATDFVKKEVNTFF